MVTVSSRSCFHKLTSMFVEVASAGAGQEATRSSGAKMSDSDMSVLRRVTSRRLAWWFLLRYTSAGEFRGFRPRWTIPAGVLPQDDRNCTFPPVSL